VRFRNGTEARMETKWMKRWDSWIAATPIRPGVFRRKEGGFLVRGRVTDPRTGKLKEIRITLLDVDARSAYTRLQEELEKVRNGMAPEEPARRTRFTEYAASLFELKLKTGAIKSAKSREKWEYMIRLHLAPAFGDFFVDGIRRTEINEWRKEMGELIEMGKLHPGTANDRLAMLGRILNAAAEEFEWERNPMAGVQPFDTSEHPTYTEEEPNSLEPDEVPAFLNTMRKLFPQHFAMTALGFTLGLRPSSLRPLRRCGDAADVKWDENVLLVRQSQTKGEEVMKTTKTRKRQKVFVPGELMDILQWHVDEQIAEPIKERSDLLFPSRTGGFRAGSVLDKPFAEVVKALGLKKHVSARAMRRTYQDLGRAAEVNDIVIRAVSGHRTKEMQEHYSTVVQTEMREGIAKIVALAGVREAMARERPARARVRRSKGAVVEAGAGDSTALAGGMEVVCVDENENGQSAVAR
jgi:hypothetical protein